MTILNWQEYEAEKDANFQTNGNQEITGAQLNQILQDTVDSTREYSAIITGGATTFPVTTTPTKLTSFDTCVPLSTNPLVSCDVVGDRLLIYEPGIYRVSCAVTGEYGNSDDLGIEVRLDGVASPLFGPVWQNGEGGSNPVSLSYTATRIVPVATPGAPVAVELYARGLSSFNVTQLGLLMTTLYVPWTIRLPS